MRRRTFISNTVVISTANLVSGIIPLRNAFILPQSKQIASTYVPGALIPVLTRSYNNARSCTNSRETILNVQNLTTQGIKRLFSVSTQGDPRCEAQPLIVPAVKMSNGPTRDLLIQATMDNNVLAYDINDTSLVWNIKLGTAIKDTQAIDQWKINPNWGILSTPVIDPDTNILYCVTWISPNGLANNAIHHIHAIDITRGQEVHPALSLQGATYFPGGGLAPQKFVSIQRKQRCGLLLTNINGIKTIFIGCGSVVETANQARGWVIAVDVKTFTVSAAFATAVRYSGGGIWQAAQGLSSDSKGYIYCMTGNGAFDGVTEWGECFLKLKYTPPSGTTNASLKVYDWWSPFSDSGRAGQDPTLPSTAEGGDNAPTNDGEFKDQDLGSGGPVCIEEMGILAGAGKDGIFYVTNLANMGKTSNKDFANPAANYAKLKSPPIWFTFYPGDGISPAPQDITQIDKYYNNLTHHQHSTPVVYNSPVHGKMLFTWGENGNLRAWSIDANGVLTYLACSAEIASPLSANDGHQGGMPGGMLSVSCNEGVVNTGLLWALVPQGDANRDPTPGILYCYDPDNFGTFSDGSRQLKVLWNSANWNLAFTHPKFNVPVVSGGKLFVPTYDGRVDVYGLA